MYAREGGWWNELISRLLLARCFARFQVRAQTIDVAALLRSARRRSRTPGGGGLAFSYYLFLEDDFLPCRDALLGLWYLVRRAEGADGTAASAVSSWAALRASFGLNGILVHASDLSAIEAHLTRGEARKVIGPRKPKCYTT